MTAHKRIGKPALVAALSLIALLLSITMAPATYAAPIVVGGKAVVTNSDGDTIRLREGAGTDYDQIGEAYEGQSVTVLAGPAKDSKGRAWYKVKAPGGTGWIAGQFLNGAAPSAQPVKSTNAAKLSGYAHVANTDGDSLRVRAAASRDAKTLTNLPADSTVSVKAGPVSDDAGIAWYQVSANGVTGWVMAQYLAPGKSLKQMPKLSGYAQVANTDGDPLRVRSEASRNGKTLANLAPGTTVVVKDGPTADSEGIAWYKVSANGVTGWAMADYLAPAQAPSQAASKTSAKLSGFAKVANTNGDSLRMRASASRDGKVITMLAPNTVVAVKAGPVSDKNGIAWYQVSANGATGWVMSDYLVQSAAPEQPATEARSNKPAAASTPKPAQSASAGNRSGTARGADAPKAPASSRGGAIVDTAMQYVGYRYRFGGTSPSGFDCSGFVYYVLNKAGVRVGRSMESQLASGPRVSSKDLQPGDLVFFVNTYKRGLSHAGIYIGNGKFVHASNERTGVIVSQLWSSYWAAHYYTAVRPY